MTRIRMRLAFGLLALALVLAGCGGDGGKSNGMASVGGKATTSPGGSSDPTQAALAHARCMRQHGINTPDPQITADGPELRYPRGVDPDDPRLKAAEQACKQYLPDTLGP